MEDYLEICGLGQHLSMACALCTYAQLAPRKVINPLLVRTRLSQQLSMACSGPPRKAVDMGYILLKFEWKTI